VLITNIERAVTGVFHSGKFHSKREKKYSLDVNLIIKLIKFVQ